MTDTNTDAPYEFDPAAFSQAAQNDPMLQQKADSLDGTQRIGPAPQRNQGAPVSSLWSRIKGAAASAFDPSQAKLGMAATRGALEFGNALSNTIVGAAVGISKHTGLYKLGRSPEEQEQFLKAWDKPIAEANPIQTTEDQIDRWAGPKQGGGWGLVSGLTQYALGMATTGGFADALLPEVMAAGKVGTALKAGREIMKGAAIDMSSFDPHNARLANLVQDTPFANPVTDYLSAKQTDGELESRFKQALEGMAMGQLMHISTSIAGKTITGLGRVSDIAFGQAKAAKLLGAGDTEGAAKVLQESQEAAVAPRPTDDVKVVPTEDGGYEVHPLNDPSVVQSPEGHFVVAGDKTETQYTTREAAQAAATTAPKDELQIVHGGTESPDGTPAPTVPKYATLEEAANVADSINFDAAVQKLGYDSGTFGDPKNVEGWRAAFRAYAESGDIRKAYDVRDAVGVNPRNFTAPDEIMNTIKSIVDVGGEAMEVARQGSPENGVSRLQTGQEAMALNASWKTPDEAFQAVSRIFGNTDGLAKQVTAARLFLYDVAQKAHAASKLADQMPENSVAMKTLADALTQLHNVHAMVTGTVSSIGRTLDSMNIDIHSLANGTVKTGTEVANAAGTAATKVLSPLDGLTRNELRDLARSIFMGNPENPGELLDALRGTKETERARLAVDVNGKPQPTGLAKVRDVALSWRMEAMLSGITTHVGNMVSNTTSMLLRPAEYWWAGTTKGMPELKQMGSDMLAPAQLAGDAYESLQMMLKAFKTGDNVLEGSNPYGLDSLNSTADLKDDDGRILWGNALKFAAKLPSRMLMSSDEFFKQLNYRMNIRAQIMRQARSEGVDADEMARRLGDMKKFMFKSAEDGSTGEAVNAWALNYARVSTFTNDLGQVIKGTDADGNKIYTDSMGKRMQDAAGNHTLIRLILPFVKTPVNIFRFAQERTPFLASFSKSMQDDLASGDPERMAIAKSKTQLGGLVWTTAATLAYNKVITGKGPSDPGLRDEMKAAGWRPYSIRIGDRYVSFRRADPVFTSFSIAADIMDTASEMMATGTEDWQALPAAFIASVTSAVTSKAFLQGLSNTLDAVSSGKGNVMQSLITNTAGSFIPTFFRGVDPNDGIMETRSMMDDMMSRLPGFSQNLEPKRDLFGKPVVRPPGLADGVDNMFNPFTISGKVLPEDVMNQLVKLGKSIPKPPERIQNGQIDLTDRQTFNDRKLPNGQYQSPYDRMMEIMSKSDARQTVVDLIKSDDYKTLSDDEKYLMTSSIIHGYQDMAYAQMLGEYPSVQEALGQEATLRGASLAGGEAEQSAKISEITQMSKLFVKPKHRYDPSIPE